MSRGIDLQKPSALDRPLCVIAEIGSCHDGSLATAKSLAKMAVVAGADVVKAQYWSSAARLAERRNAAEYEAVYEKYRVPREWLPELAEYVDSLGAEFACTSYLPEDVWEVFRHASIMKIASFEAEDPELLTCHREPLRRGRWVVVSLGMGAVPDRVVDRLGVSDEFRFEVGVRPRLRLLHCVSAYPAPIDQLSLARIRGRVRLSGFSDHADIEHVYSGALAAAAGARVLEKHIRLAETSPDNPDWGHSLDPVHFAEYVRLARQGAEAYGANDHNEFNFAYQPAPCEQAMTKYKVTR